MKKKLSKDNLWKCFITGFCVLLTGCGSIGLAREADFESAFENVPEEKIDIYTSEGYGVLEQVDGEGCTITVYQINNKEELTLSYDDATTIQDRYGSPLVMEQLSPGEIIMVDYNSSLEKAGRVMVSPDAWSYDGVVRHTIDEAKGSLTVGSDTYRISAETKVFSGTEQITLNQILEQDVLSLRGTDRDIASIVVEKGHGYLNLENDEELVGGWIEVGQTLIQQISDDMLIAVPEGSYTVRLTIDKVDVAREITIERGKETVLDLSDVEVPQPVSGQVVFSIYPEEADVYVDGVSVNTAYTVLLPFGLHQITASASGYDTVSEYFNVEGEITTVKLALSEYTGSTVSGNSAPEEDYHTITIQAPENVEVYQDNLYMGIAPVTFKKTEGTHTITLRKTGYVTKSYQIVAEDDDRDLVYSFPDLEKETTSSTVSGNRISDGNNQNAATVSGNNATVSGNNVTVSGNEATVSGNN